MKRLVMILGLAGTLALPVAGQTTSTVTWYLKTVAGNPQNRALTITPLVDPEDYWTNILWDVGWTIQPTNGVATAVLEPNEYLVTMQGVAGDMSISVGTNGGLYNALSLTTDVTNYLSATSGPATVVFSTLNFGGGAQNRALRISPINPALPMQNGTNIVWGAPLAVTPTNGLARVALEPMGYRVDANASGMPGAMVIYVPTDAGTYSAAMLPSTMPAPAPGLPPAPVLSGGGLGGSLTQTSIGVGDAGGYVRLYWSEDGATGWTLWNQQPFSSPLSWASLDIFGTGMGGYWRATEVGNGTNYAGESLPSNVLSWSNVSP